MRNKNSKIDQKQKGKKQYLMINKMKKKED